MNDFDALEAMLNRAGIAFTYDKETRVLLIQSDGTGPRAETKPLVGYVGFYTEFAFDDHGMLRQVGIWE